MAEEKAAGAAVYGPWERVGLESGKGQEWVEMIRNMREVAAEEEREDEAIWGAIIYEREDEAYLYRNHDHLVHQVSPLF